MKVDALSFLDAAYDLSTDTPRLLAALAAAASKFLSERAAVLGYEVDVATQRIVRFSAHRCDELYVRAVDEVTGMMSPSQMQLVSRAPPSLVIPREVYIGTEPLGFA